MSELKLYGMKNAYEKIIATAVKRQNDPERVVGDLLIRSFLDRHCALGVPNE